MKTKISTKGQVILPKILRDRLHWKPGMELDIEARPDGVLLKPGNGKNWAHPSATPLRDFIPVDAPIDLDRAKRPQMTGISRGVDEFGQALRGDQSKDQV